MLFIRMVVTHMKKTLQLFCLTILISNFSFSQNQNISNDSIKYFDENYNPISKEEYENRNWRGGMLSLQGDSIHHRILSFRIIEGTIENKEILDSLLASATNRKIDSSRPLVIIYYPGKDPCNSSGTFNRKKIGKGYNTMEKGVNKIKESTVLYVYKDNDGLYDRNDGFKDWIKDPERTIERLFFNRHYPCGSFVVISEKGKFISYFGEPLRENIWEAVKDLIKK